jgi:O-antigen ligase
MIGMFYGNDFKSGMQVLETKLSFLIFPLIYSSYYRLTINNLNKYLKSFIGGCIVYAIVCLGWASYCYFKPVYTDYYGAMLNLGSNYFYYTTLSKLFHPSYIAMYLTFSLFSVWFLVLKRIIKFNFWWILIIVILITFVLLLSSKSGWIGLLMWALCISIWQFSPKSVFISLGKFSFIIAAFLFLNLYFTPNFSNRIPNLAVIKNAIQGKDEQNNKITTSDDGSARRVFVWKASVDVIKQNLFWGVGTGDTRDELLNMYLKKGMNAEYKAALNSHNQFLNTGVQLGAVGVFVLFMLFFSSIRYFLRSTWRWMILVVFLINFLVESFLETQAGIVLFCILILLFFNPKLNNDMVQEDHMIR